MFKNFAWRHNRPIYMYLSGPWWAGPHFLEIFTQCLKLSDKILRFMQNTISLTWKSQHSRIPEFALCFSVEMLNTFSKKMRDICVVRLFWYPFNLNFWNWDILSVRRASFSMHLHTGNCVYSTCFVFQKKSVHRANWPNASQSIIQRISTIHSTCDLL